MRQGIKGFTLIELMITLAILGIIAALAIPQYKSYAAKAQLTEALQLASGLKPYIADVIQHEGAEHANSGYGRIPEANQVTGRYVDSISVSEGNMTITLKPPGSSGVSDLIGGLTVTLSLQAFPTGSSPLLWQCAGSVSAQYLPKNC